MAEDDVSQALDQDLVARVQRGDSAAFDLLVRKYQHRVGALISRYIHDWAEVQDVAQDTFIRAYRAIGGFRGDAQFSTWLYRIAINEVRRTQRGGVLRRALAMALGREPTAAVVVEPEQAAIKSEAFAELQRILAGMKEKKRAVFVLYELEELSPSEIAGVLGCSVDTVKSRLRHAREEFEQLRRRRQLVSVAGGKR